MTIRKRNTAKVSLTATKRSKITLILLIYLSFFGYKESKKKRIKGFEVDAEKSSLGSKATSNS